MRFKTGFSVVCALFIAGAATASAQWSMQLGVGASVPVAKFPSGTGTGFMVSASIIGYDFSDKIGMYAGGYIQSFPYNYTKYSTEYKGSVGLLHGTLGGMYRFNGNGATPYITFGVGILTQVSDTYEYTTSSYGYTSSYSRTKTESRSDLVLQGGFGYQYALSDNWKLFADAQYVIVNDTWNALQSLPIRLGARYRF